MLDSKDVFYTINSFILVLVAILPSNNIKAREEKEESDPSTIFSNTKNLLQKSITEVQKGNYTGASELVYIAYIDNFEYIEDPLKELDKDLMEEAEVMIREDFAGVIEG